MALAIGIVLLFARPAAAEAPIPGSPLDAYDRQMLYDMGVHLIARLCAIISYVLMVATVVLGVALRMRYFQRRVNRSTVYGAHMTIAVSALIFGAPHGMTFRYQLVWQIGTAHLVVPFTGGQQPISVGLGILGTELAVAAGCSVWLQQRLGGVDARLLPRTPVISNRIRTVRTLADAFAIQQAMRTARTQHVVILGGGFVGQGRPEGIDRRHVPATGRPRARPPGSRQVQRRTCPASPTTEPRPTSPQPRAAAAPLVRATCPPRGDQT
ncbi:hypothetical protein ACWCXH_39715 [Kitasatospora sp. NPDC001660]